MTRAEVNRKFKDLERGHRWKIMQFHLGRCSNCGKPRKDSPYLRLCKPCGAHQKVRRRKKQSSSKWVKGSPGRPPLWAQKESK